MEIRDQFIDDGHGAKIMFHSLLIISEQVCCLYSAHCSWNSNAVSVVERGQLLLKGAVTNGNTGAIHSPSRPHFLMYFILFYDLIP